MATKADEGTGRAAFIAEARTWLGTPFRDQGDIKGPNGAVDCAMLLVRCAVDTGVLEPFDPRPYPGQWLLHKDEERFLNIVRRFGTEVQRTPNPGDVIVYKVARCFAHGAICISDAEILHAWFKRKKVCVSRMDESDIAFDPKTGKPRPFKVFDLWSSAP